MKAEIQVSATGKAAPQAPRTLAGDASRRQPQNDHKRKAPQPASSSRQVTTVEDQQPEGQPPTKQQKGGKSNWLPAFSYEQTLDCPCKSHSGAKPSNHTTRKCHWLTRIAKETASFLLRLLGRCLHYRPSTRLPGQSAPYKMNTQKSTELM